MNSKGNLCEFGTHSEKCGDPHPENSTGSADGNGTCHSGNISGTYCGGKSRTHSLERSDSAVGSAALAENTSKSSADRIGELADLKKTGADAKVKSDAENTDHCRNSPDKIIDSCINGFDNLQHKIPLLSFLSDKVCFDLILRLWSGNSRRFTCFDTFQKPCHIVSQGAHDL